MTDQDWRTFADESDWHADLNAADNKVRAVIWCVGIAAVCLIGAGIIHFAT